MKIHDVVQGTTEWLQLRAGIPTASEFHRILTPKTMKESASAEPYRFELLAERIMGHPLVEQVTLWMERGSEMEADAVSRYEFQNDIDTTPVGFITNDEGTVGASPDRLVGPRGLVEIKCPSEGVHVRYLLKAGSAYSTYKVQVQGQLWIAERDWVDVISYHPEMPEAVIRIPRDEPFIEKLAAAVTAFSDALEEKWLGLLMAGVVTAPRPTPPRIKSMAEILKEELAQMNQEQEAGFPPSPSPSVP